MLDIGFIWYVIKSMRIPFLIVVWAFCLWYSANTDLAEPYKTIGHVIAIAGIVYIWGGLTVSIIKDKYREYRREKEAAWEILKKE
jgi:hypothetical protein